MQNKFILTVICIVCLVLTGCGGADKNFLGSGKAVIPTYEVKAPAAGKLLGLITEQGERITSGQPLFAMADKDTDDAVAKLTANLAKARAELKTLEEGTASRQNPGSLAALRESVASAQREADKMNRLLAMGAVSRRQADASNARLAAAKGQLAAARGHNILIRPASPEAIASQKQLISQIEKELQKNQERQRANEAVSPCTGIVTKLFAKAGDTAQKGQKILTIQALDTCTVTFKVSEAKARELKENMPVQLTADGYKAPFKGSIQKINGGEVTVISKEKPEDLKAGVSIDVAAVK